MSVPEGKADVPVDHPDFSVRPNSDISSPPSNRCSKPVSTPIKALVCPCVNRLAMNLGPRFVKDADKKVRIIELGVTAKPPCQLFAMLNRTTGCWKLYSRSVPGRNSVFNIKIVGSHDRPSALVQVEHELDTATLTWINASENRGPPTGSDDVRSSGVDRKCFAHGQSDATDPERTFGVCANEIGLSWPCRIFDLEQGHERIVRLLSGPLGKEACLIHLARIGYS